MLAGCAGSASKAIEPDGVVQANDAPTGCYVSLSFNPSPAHSGATIRAAATAQGLAGNPNYTWQVKFNNAPIATTPAAADGSQIDFFAAQAGPYDVSVDLGFQSGCDGVTDTLNVGVPGANIADYRVHVVPVTGAPPQDTIVEVDGGADADHPIALDPGLQPLIQVVSGSTGVASYVRFLSPTSPIAYVESFTDMTGALQPRVLGQPYNALVIPVSSAYAPALVTWQPGTPSIQIGTSTAVSGTVKTGGGAAIAGATVKLSSGGVPSTIATTASDGSFTVNETFATGAQVTVDVTPPTGSGLPRLSATSAFDLTSSLAVAYSAALATCNLSGTATSAGADVTIVGAVASGGTIGGVPAAGSVQIATVADGTGHLPSTLVPKASLSAVVQTTSRTVAVIATDQTTCNTAALTVPASVAATGTVTDANATLLAGAIVEASPTEELAAAGMPPLQATTSSSGVYSLALASGGHYDFRIFDPLGRAAPFALMDAAATAAPTATSLGKALHLTGKVTIVGDPNTVVGAAVQVLCSQCSGLDAQRPLAAAATDITGRYVVAVPDPGTGM